MSANGPLGHAQGVELTGNALWGINVIGVGASVPETAITNAQLSERVDTSDEWIISRTGIKERRVVAGDETVATLGADAAREALACAGIAATDIDLIVVASSTPDTIYPMASAQIQEALGIPHVAGFDLTAACTGFAVANITASQFLRSGMYKTALVVGSDIHSRVTDWTDRNTCVLFGDGAGAFILQAVPAEANAIKANEMHLDGSKGTWLQLKTSLKNCPMVTERTEPSPYVAMNGRDIFKFAVSSVPESIRKTTEQAGWTLQDLDYVVLHQANTRIIQAISEKLDLPVDKFLLDMAYYGNTSAASIPIALTNALVAGKLKPGQKIAMCGFGAGLSWATIVFEWTCHDHRRSPLRVGNTPVDAPV
jgi:3-oxoacyl-[acyl-carrier-protein] synthase III